MKDTCVYVLYYHMCTRFETKVRLYPNALIADKNVGKNRPWNKQNSIFAIIRYDFNGIIHTWSME